MDFTRLALDLLLAATAWRLGHLSSSELLFVAAAATTSLCLRRFVTETATKIATWCAWASFRTPSSTPRSAPNRLTPWTSTRGGSSRQSRAKTRWLQATKHILRVLWLRRSWALLGHALNQPFVKALMEGTKARARSCRKPPSAHAVTARLLWATACSLQPAGSSTATVRRLPGALRHTASRLLQA
jgi:hypothetical protein